MRRGSESDELHRDDRLPQRGQRTHSVFRYTRLPTDAGMEPVSCSFPLKSRTCRNEMSATEAGMVPASALAYSCSRVTAPPAAHATPWKAAHGSVGAPAAASAHPAWFAHPLPLVAAYTSPSEAHVASCGTHTRVRQQHSTARGLHPHPHHGRHLHPPRLDGARKHAGRRQRERGRGCGRPGRRRRGQAAVELAERRGGGVRRMM